MLEKLKSLEARYGELTRSLSDPEVHADKVKFTTLSKNLAELEPLVQKFIEYRGVLDQLTEMRAWLESADAEEREMAQAELPELKQRESSLERELQLLLIPSDPNDAKDVILEVRAGTGGEEAALFASQIVRMYTRYAERAGWKVDIVNLSETEIGGVKEATLSIAGKKVYSRLKYESGVHRVQRVPVTETSGRIHTSAVTVAVLPEAEEVDVQINESTDLRIDTYCSSGPGGQSVNTTYSAVRITHLPTGKVVSIQDEKSQIKNKAKALKVLRARLYEDQQNELHEARAGERRSQVGSGDRSEKIRTYNFRENRVSDHRIGLTLHQLPAILEGGLDPILDALVTHYQAEKLRESLPTAGEPVAS